jgi:hypothetical protein
MIIFGHFGKLTLGRCFVLPTRFMRGEQFKGIRDSFFDGEPIPTRSSSHKEPKIRHLSGLEMLHRIDTRLRRVIVRACANSVPATTVVERFEKFVFEVFAHKESQSVVCFDGILLEPPTISTKPGNSSVVTCQFYFDPESSPGGFHRLLFHAVCQFHGLDAVSSMVAIQINEHSSARVLIVSGCIDAKIEHRLLEVITNEHLDVVRTLQLE